MGRGSSDVLVFWAHLSHAENSNCMRVKAFRIFLHSGRSYRTLKIHILWVSGPRLFGCSFILGASVAYEKFVWYAGHGASDIIIFGHATVSKTSDFQLIYFRICGISGEHCVNKRMPQGGGIKIIKIWPSPGKVNYTPQSLINRKMLKNRCNLLSMSL